MSQGQPVNLDRGMGLLQWPADWPVHFCFCHSTPSSWACMMWQADGQTIQAQPRDLEEWQAVGSRQGLWLL